MASNSLRIPLDRKLYDAAKNGDVVLLNQLLFPRPIQVGEIAVPVEGEAEAPHQSPRSQARCLLGVTHGGDTALHIAAHFGHLNAAKVICGVNVSLLMKDNDKLETPLHYAARAGKRDLVDYFIQLAKAEANNIDLGEMLTKRNRDGETALYQAVLYDHPAVVKEFLCADENPYVSQLVSIPNNENISPLYLAIMHGLHDVVASLIGSLPENVSRGAYAGPDGQTALHAAALRPEGKTKCKSYFDYLSSIN